MRTTSLTLINPLGMHARAASKLVDACKPFASDVKLTLDGKTVDGKSIMSLLMLGAPVGTELILEVDGDDEEQAFEAICEIVNAGFYEMDDD
ncbi:MAG: HPr family phosphocarrier protein [Pseudomonadales bacterium]|nr:HPr family phosphocarrier protein [Pseudomonadales bacterium]